MLSVKPFFVFLCVISFTAICEQSFAQEYPRSYFRSPLDIPLFLSGNFGEMRTNHFHTGLDIKTAGVEGQKVRAVADGYVSRVKKSPWGYGNVVYITHPNGFTSVYAHLRSFSPDIEAFYQTVQRKKELYAVDVLPGKGMIPVKKGEIIAYSGNSGSSGGPHLHFEIRETETEKPINPMLFGFNITDNIPPTIQGIRVYRFPNDSAAGVCNTSYPVSGSNGTYRLKNPVIELAGYGNYGIAVHSTDMLNGSGNICGIYISRLYLDGKLIFEQQIDTLDFYTNRYMNAHTDYALYRETKRSYHKSFIEPNNKLSIYKKAVNNGYIEISDNNSHDVRYEIFDVSGNKSVVSFTIINRLSRSMSSEPQQNVISCCANTEFHLDDLNLYFPAGTLYNNTPLEHHYVAVKQGYSDLHIINSTSIPVQQNYFIEIRGNVPEKLASKALLIEEDKGLLYAHGGIYKDGWIRSRVRTFGTFFIDVDTTAPAINFMNLRNGARIGNRNILISATDDLSGIETFNAYINGNWAPTEYDARKKRYIVHMDLIDVPNGTNELRFVAIDERKNQSEERILFVR